MTTPTTDAVRAVAELERDHGSDAEFQATVRLPDGVDLTVAGRELAGWTGGLAAAIDRETDEILVGSVLAVHKPTGAAFELARLRAPMDGVVVYGKVSALLEHALPPSAA
jgi:hypothetical protein